MRVDPAVVQEVASEVVLQLVLDGDIRVSPERVPAVERQVGNVMRLVHKQLYNPLRAPAAIGATEAGGEPESGVANVPSDITDGEVLTLAEAGVRAFRVNLFRGADIAQVALAPRLYELAGWHLEVYLDARDLPELAPKLAVAPRLVIDHLGMTQAGLPALLGLVKDGAYVKASGFGRIDVDPYSALKAIAVLNPAAPLFGSDLPGTRAPRPFEAADIELVGDAAGERALYDNALALYGVT